jgi:uncharacterized protein YuzE
MFIQLTDHIPVRTQKINDSLFLEFDEFDQIRGIEILDVSTIGVNPLELVSEHFTAANSGKRPRPTDEESEAYRAERNAAKERYKARKATENANDKSPEKS